MNACDENVSIEKLLFKMEGERERDGNNKSGGNGERKSVKVDGSL